MSEPLRELSNNPQIVIIKNQPKQEDFSNKYAKSVFEQDLNSNSGDSNIFKTTDNKDQDKKLLDSYNAYKNALSQNDEEKIQETAKRFTVDSIMADLKDDGKLNQSIFKKENKFGNLSQSAKNTQGTENIPKDELLKILLKADKEDDGKINGSPFNNPGIQKYFDIADDGIENNSFQNYNSFLKEKNEGGEERFDQAQNYNVFDILNPLEGLPTLDSLGADPFGIGEIRNLMSEMVYKPNQYADVDPKDPESYKYTVNPDTTGKFNQATNLGIPLGGGKLKTIKSKSGAKLSVNQKVASQFQGFINELESMGYKIDPKTSGGFDFRKIAGSSSYSQHAYGNAIDINSVDNGLGKGKGTLPANISSIAAKYGLSWGGDFKTNNDPMHFEAAKIMPMKDTERVIG